MFFCEFCKIFKNTYFEEHLGTTASVIYEQQRQPSKVFCEKMYSRKFRKFHRKTPGLSFSIKLQAFRPTKETPTQLFSCEICEIYKNTFFEENLRTAASRTSLNLFSIKSVWISKSAEHTTYF